MSRLILLLVDAFLIAAASVASAQSGDFQFHLPSSLTSGFGAASYDSYSAQFNANLGLRTGYRLGLGVGGSWGKSDDGAIVINSNRVSFGTDPLNLFSGSLGYERWGQASVLQTETLSPSIMFSHEHFSAEVTPSIRSIAWFSRMGGTSDRRLYARSQGLSGSLGLFFLSPVSLRFSAATYTYFDVPSDFENLALAGFLSLTSLNLGSGFLDHSYSAELGVNLGKWSLTGEYYSARAFIDKIDFSAITVWTDYAPSNAWGYRLLAGQTSAPDNPVTYQSELSLSYYWQ
ncbi:MAG TPA: hypothetical protein VFV50_04890 [Bdellovibrionales bacterium]|nr:hypothetical protein [Bdellovibrionales bacterium]